MGLSNASWPGEGDSGVWGISSARCPRSRRALAEDVLDHGQGGTAARSVPDTTAAERLAGEVSPSTVGARRCGRNLPTDPGFSISREDGSTRDDGGADIVLQPGHMMAASCSCFSGLSAGGAGRGLGPRDHRAHAVQVDPLGAVDWSMAVTSNMYPGCPSPAPQPGRSSSRSMMATGSSTARCRPRPTPTRKRSWPGTGSTRSTSPAARHSGTTLSTSPHPAWSSCASFSTTSSSNTSFGATGLARHCHADHRVVLDRPHGRRDTDRALYHAGADGARPALARCCSHRRPAGARSPRRRARRSPACGCRGCRWPVVRQSSVEALGHGDGFETGRSRPRRWSTAWSSSRRSSGTSQSSKSLPTAVSSSAVITSWLLLAAP